MGVDHGGGHIRVAQQFLHRANVRTGFQQVRGEAMTQRVRMHGLGDAGGPRRLLDRALDGARIDVVPAVGAGPVAGLVVRAGEHPLPRQFASGARIFAADRVRKFNIGPAIVGSVFA